MSDHDAGVLPKSEPAKPRVPTFALPSIDAAHAVVVLILVSSVVRIVLAAAFGLGTDESYTVANARILALSYVDYPPLHVWLVGVWSWLWNSDAPFVVRLPFIALFAGSTWMMFRLSSFLFDARAGFWAALLFNLAPVFTLAHASWVLPDGPLIFFLLASAWVVARLLFTGPAPSRSVSGWLLAGALAGLAVLSKYHGLFLLAGVFVFLLSWPPGRRVLASPGPWLGALTTLLLFAPVLIWNADHDWVGLHFQAQRLSADLSVARVFGGIAAQAGYLTPWIFVPLLAVWLVSLARGPRLPHRWYLALLASGPIIGFTAANILSKGLPHWPMPGWLFVFPMLGAEAARLAQLRPKLMLGASSAAAVTLAAACAVLGTNAMTGWLARDMPEKFAQSDPTLDLLDWSEVRAAVIERQLLNPETPAIAAVHWMEAGKLNYALGPAFPVLCLCADPQQFRYSQDPERFAGRNILVIGAHRDFKNHETTLTRWFSRVETLEPIMLNRGGHPAMELTVVRGIGFRPNRAATVLAQGPMRDSGASE
jgi:Dolichyl-phosphate-mannose-protein mannosyltransferase